MFLNHNYFFNLNSYCPNLLDIRNLQEHVKKTFCYQNLFWPFTVWINCSGDLKIFVNSRPSASNFKSFSRSLEQFFLTVGQNNFGNKIPFLLFEELLKLKGFLKRKKNLTLEYIWHDTGHSWLLPQLLFPKLWSFSGPFSHRVSPFHIGHWEKDFFGNLVWPLIRFTKLHIHCLFRS